MKLSKVTIEVLKNFAGINQGIVFTEGTELRTMNVMKSIFATAEIPDTIPMGFAIYDLNEFLATYSLMTGADVSFNKDYLVISINNKIKYFYSSPSVVVSPGDKKITLPSEDMKFVLEADDFDQIMKASAVMKLKEITINCNGLKIWNRNNVGNHYEIDKTVQCGNGTNSAIIKVENLKLIGGIDYDVSICDGRLAKFSSKSEEYNLNYYIALESVD